MFPDEKFDFVYSYAVFQHIPSREVVFNYLREARRVLKTGGILRCQMNGLPPHAKQYDTWSGVRITDDEIRQFAREQDMQLLVVEQIWTQYMWITCRKRPAGWTASLAGRRVPRASVIRRISNALTGEAVAPVRGPLAALSLWVEGLPDEADLNHMTVTADGRACRLIYIGEPEKDGIAQVNVALPEGLRTGMVPVEIVWLGQPVAEPALGADHARRALRAAHHHRHRRHQPAFRNAHRDGLREGHHARSGRRRAVPRHRRRAGCAAKSRASARTRSRSATNSISGCRRASRQGRTKCWSAWASGSLRR